MPPGQVDAILNFMWWMRLLRKTYSLYNSMLCLKVRDHVIFTTRFFFFFFGEMFHQRNCLHVVNQKYDPLNILYFSKIKHSSTLTKTYMCYNWKQNAVICRVCGHDMNTMYINAVQQWHLGRLARWHLSCSYHDTHPDPRLLCPSEDQEHTCSRTTEHSRRPT